MAVIASIPAAVSVIRVLVMSILSGEMDAEMQRAKGRLRSRPPANQSKRRPPNH
jgi:hypothetical protein